MEKGGGGGRERERERGREREIRRDRDRDRETAAVGAKLGFNYIYSFSRILMRNKVLKVVFFFMNGRKLLTSSLTPNNQVKRYLLNVVFSLWPMIY